MATQPSDLYKLLSRLGVPRGLLLQRSNYFAAFETVAVAGCWHLLDTKHFWTEVGLSILGIALTITWFLNNRKDQLIRASLVECNNQAGRTDGVKTK